MSIWKGIDRAAFEARVTELHKVAPTQKSERSSTSSGSPRPGDIRRDSLLSGLPEDIEKQLSDDFAFLAAWEGSPDCVAGATVVQSKADCGLAITLAANGGVASCVTNAFQNMLQVLDTCAQNSDLRQLYSSQCLEIMLSLHRNRILGRLGSKAFSRDKRWAPREQVPIAGRLRLMTEVNQCPGGQDQQSARTILLEQIGELRNAIEKAENAARIGLSALKTITEAAAAITAGSVSLRERLKQAGYPDDFVERKEMRQIKALGNYMRCSNYLTWAARKYRSLFKNTTVVALKPYPPEYWPTRKSKHFVHAEIQLLIHHDMNTRTNPPRFIGVSKLACYLCFCFMRAHKAYCDPETHGEVHPQWTIPQRDDYTVEVWRRLNSALIKTDKDVQCALNDAKKTKIRYGPRVQSVVNSIVGSLRSPSMSTLRSAASPRNRIPLDGGVDGYDFAIEQDIQTEAELTCKSTRPAPRDIGPEKQSSKSQQGSQDSQDSTANRTIADAAPVFTIDWLELFVDNNVEYTAVVQSDSLKDRTCSSSPDKDTNEVTTSSMARSSFHLQAINVAELTTNSEFTTEQQSNANSIEVAFVNPGKQDVRVRFSLT